MIDSNLKITWLGQGGFLFDNGDIRLVIDPYLTDSLKAMGFARMVPPPARPSELAADIICCTHDHGDHFDSGTIMPMMSLAPGCILLGPESVLSHASELGLDEKRMSRVRAGIPIEKKGVTISLVPAFHSDPFALGYTFEWGGVKLYISGDTLYDNRLAPDILDALGGSPDIAVVCINGKLNNMCISEAAKLVKQLSPKAAIPMHYGLFANNTADPAPFIQIIESLGVKGILMEIGQTIQVSEMI